MIEKQEEVPASEDRKTCYGSFCESVRNMARLYKESLIQAGPYK